MTEQERKKMFEDFEDFNESRKKSEDDYYSQLEDTLNISKQINDQYRNQQRNIGQINSDISKTLTKIQAQKVAIEKNREAYKKVNTEIVQVDQTLQGLDSLRIQSLRIIQETTQKINQSVVVQKDATERIIKLKQEEQRTTEEIANLEKSSLKNKAAQEINTKALLAHRKEQRRVEEQLQGVEAAIVEKQKMGITSGDEYNKLLLRRDAIVTRAVNMRVEEAKLMDDGQKYAKRESNIQQEILNKRQRVKDIGDAITESEERFAAAGLVIDAAMKAREKAQKNEAEISEAINKKQAQRNALIERQKVLQDQHTTLTNALKKSEEYLNKLYDLRTKYIARLNFWKLIKMAYDRFVELDKAAEEFRKSTGFTNTQMVELRKNVEQVNREFADMGVTIQEAYKSAEQLVNVFERTSMVSKEAVQNVSLLAQNFGVAQEVSAQVLETFMGIGKSSEQAAFDTMKLGAALSEKTGVSFAKVMKDISSASETTINMIGASPAKLMKAAIAARALGLDINKIASSQRKLLDFSSSINDELQLSALLGKSISFQKARQLAYEGKTDEALKSTLETVKAAGDFEKMNVYQREQLAKAAGMELKDLSKALAVEKRREEILYGSDEVARSKLLAQEEELKKMKEMTEADEKDLIRQNEKLLAQQKMQGVMTKLTNIMNSMSIAFADIFEPVISALADTIVPLFKAIVAILKVTIIPLFKLMAYPLQVVGGIISDLTKKFQEFMEGPESTNKSIVSIKESFKSLFEKVSEFFDTTFGKVTKFLAGGSLLYMYLMGKFSMGGILGLIKKPFDMLGSLASKGMSKIPVIGKMFQPPSSVGATGAAAQQTAQASKATQGVKSGTGVKDFLKNLASGLKSMGNARVLLGAINLIPASIGLVAMIPGILGAKLLELINGEKLKDGLSGLAAGLKKMGNASVLLGAINLSLAAVGLVAIIPGAIAAATMSLIGKPIEIGLKFLAQGIGHMGKPQVLLGAVGLALVGASLIPFAFAMQMFSDVDWGSVGIGTLALIGFTAAAFGLGAILMSGVGAAIFGAGVIGIAALGASLIPFSLAALAAGAGVKMLGEGISTSVDPILRLSTIDLTSTALGIGAVGVALAAFGAGSAGAGLGSFVGKLLGGDPIEKMERLANIGTKLLVTASAIDTLSSTFSKFTEVEVFAKSIDALTLSLGRMNEQLEKTSTIKLAALAVMSVNTAKSSDTAKDSAAKQTGVGGGEGVIAKLDELIVLLKEGSIGVNMDGVKVSKALAKVS
jgi:hypothetical protein